MSPHGLPCFLLAGLAATATAKATVAALVTLQLQQQAQCRVLPGDADWPSAAQWAALNKTVNGRLIASVPLASACHSGGPFNNYNAAACAELQSTWNKTTLQRSVSTAHTQIASCMAG